jgi:hypothetical protein
MLWTGRAGPTLVRSTSGGDLCRIGIAWLKRHPAPTRIHRAVPTTWGVASAPGFEHQRSRET